MIEFHDTFVDLNNTTVWDVFIGGEKIGSLMKITPYKINGRLIDGSYHLDVLNQKYNLSLANRKYIIPLIEMRIQSLESALIMAKIEQTEWHKERVKAANRFNEIIGDSMDVNEWICAIRQVENERLSIKE